MSDVGSQERVDALHGLRVIDFLSNAAGPVCGMLLGDFGSDVIKLEPPSGDATRQCGKNRLGKNKQLTGTHLAMNRNKIVAESARWEKIFRERAPVQ